jgi:hypothetical protein
MNTLPASTTVVGFRMPNTPADTASQGWVDIPAGFMAMPAPYRFSMVMRNS